MKSSLNKTIDFSVDEGQEYLAKCIKIESRPNSLHELLDKTIHGDSFQVLRLLPQESIDLIIADPPYNIRKEFNSTNFQKMTNDKYENYTREWLSSVRSLLKPNGSIYVCCDWRSSLIIGRVLEEMFIVRNRITWQREKGRGAMANWKNGLEDIWFATNSKDYTFNLNSVKVRRQVIAPYRVSGKPKDWIETSNGNYRDTCPSNFWDDITIPFWSMPENTAHPTQKPEKLIAKLILASSNPNDLILDPFVGSGTTSVVAKKLGRHYCGIESDAQYCAWAEYRLQRAENNSSIQGYNDGVFWERNTLNQQLQVAEISPEPLHQARDPQNRKKTAVAKKRKKDASFVQLDLLVQTENQPEYD